MKKGCFLFQNNVARLAHGMALEMKKKYGVEEFCGYIFSRTAEDFIKNQNDIKYTNLLADHDLYKQAQNEKLDLEYIKHLEKEYGIPGLWPFIDVDRTIMMSIPPKAYSGKIFDPAYSHEGMLKLLQVYFKNIIKMLETEKPDFIFFFAIGTMSHLVLYYVAKKMGIKVLNLDLTRLGNKITLTESYRTFTGTDDVFKKIQTGQMQSAKKEEAQILLKNFRETGSLNLPYGINSGNHTPPASPLRSLLFFLKHTANYIRNPHKDDWGVEDPWNFFKNKARNKSRKLFRKIKDVSRMYDKVNFNEDFAFFPLHYEPETSMSLFSEFYRDQIALIRQIARSLPVHFKLYVKEHPAMVPFRPIGYYKEIKRVPNVKLINPSIKSFEIIKNAKLTTVITSTAAWEAAMLGKPAISFGDVFYNSLSFIKKCREIENLPFLVREQLENFKYREEEMINFLSAILEDSADVNFHQLAGQPEMKGTFHNVNEIMMQEDFKKLVGLLAKKLSLTQ